MSDKRGIIKGVVSFKFQVRWGFLFNMTLSLLLQSFVLTQCCFRCAFLAMVERAEKLGLWINLENAKWVLASASYLSLHTSVLVSKQSSAVVLWIWKHSKAGDGAESELWQQTGTGGTDNRVFLSVKPIFARNVISKWKRQHLITSSVGRTLN